MNLGRRVLLIGGATLAAGTVGGLVFAGSTYASGWAMGSLQKFGPKGTLVDTGEGYLLLGQNSSRQFAFSSSLDFVRSFEREEEARVSRRERRLRGAQVAIRYREMQKQVNPLAGDTNVVVEEIAFVDPALGDRHAHVLPGRRSGRSDAFRTGRIVNIARRGTVFKSWEIELQEGGDRFHSMSILDESIYDAALTFLRSGRQVSLDYSQSNFRNPLTRETTYEVIGVGSVG